jgi:hypothetical protein
MFRPLTLKASTRPRFRFLVLAALLSGFSLAACSSDPPPDMNTVRKLINEDRQFDALKTLIPLAQSGDPAAQYELAGFYHYGYVGANDYAKALKWYRASARQGYADSMVGLSAMYLGGQGVAKDRREAYVWLNLAAQYMKDPQALAKVKSVRDSIGKTLTKDDIAYAKAESLLLQPDSASVQPNESESIDHLPDVMPAEEAPAAVTTEPLQNVPPDTAPLGAAPANGPPAGTTTTGSAPELPQMELQPSLPAAPRPAPATTLPATTTPASAAPASSTLPATTAPATVPPPPTGTTDPAPADSTKDVNPVPEF